MSIYQKASLVQIPSGYKAADAKLYSVVPNSGDGDFTVSSDADATRVNKDGLVETTVANQARLNYDPANPQDPHLLLEPTRTNVFPVTEDFTNAQWFKSNSNVNGNTQTSPSGTLTADTVNVTSSGGGVFDFNQWQTTQRTASVFAKKGTVNKIKIRNGSIAENGVVFDLNNGVIESVTSSFSATMEAYPNGWYRLTVTHTATTNQTFAIVSDTTGSFYLWGAQMEAGSYATSYIPNATTGTVTRTADTCKLENFNNMPTNYPFTVFCDMDFIEDDKGYGFSIIDISSSSNYFSVGYSEDGGTLGKFRFTNRAQGTGYNFNTLSTYGTGRYKIAVKFISATNFKGFINGVEVADYTHPSSPFNTNINDVLLGQLRVAGDTGDRNPIHQFMIFNEALTDNELEQITSYDSFGQMAKALSYTIE